MKIYMVEASWYDKIYEVNCTQNIAAFTSKESAQKYIETFSEVNEAAFNAHIFFNGVPYDELEFWISEYELKN